MALQLSGTLVCDQHAEGCCTLTLSVPWETPWPLPGDKHSSRQLCTEHRPTAVSGPMVRRGGGVPGPPLPVMGLTARTRQADCRAFQFPFNSLRWGQAEAPGSVIQFPAHSQPLAFSLRNLFPVLKRCKHPRNWPPPRS